MPRRFQNKSVGALAASIICGFLVGCAPTPQAQTFVDDFQRGLAAYDRGDYTAARAFWQPLADNYDLAALRNIGHLYRLGQGVARDGAKAVRYYTRAAELGFGGFVRGKRQCPTSQDTSCRPVAPDEWV